MLSTTNNPSSPFRRTRLRYLSFSFEAAKLDFSANQAANSAHLQDAAAVQPVEMDHVQQPQQHLDPSPMPDDTLGGLDGSPQITPESAFRHSQSQSLDQGLANAAHEDSPRPEDSTSANASPRYTPPVSSAPSLSRPASGLSNPMQQSQNQQEGQQGQNHVVIKVGMVGDAQIGKTSLMVKYVEGSWDEDYIQTLGVNFMEKTISIRNTEITFSIWDLGGQREFVNMLPLVCNDAVAILFMFDLTRKSTLNSIKEWYRQGRGFNKTAIPILVGTKYDHFVNFPPQDQEEITNQVS